VCVDAYEEYYLNQKMKYKVGIDAVDHSQMVSRKILIITALLFIVNSNVLAQEIWTVGPMLHANFGRGKPTVSFAIEGAYWNVSQFPYSVDFGIEFDRRKTTRFYSELQTGIGVAGISVGPVLQVGGGDGAKLGLQGTAWINYYLGLDYRMRFFRGQKHQSAGLYAKLPVATTGLDDGDGGDSWGDWD
jgi:hypothetical protein